MKDLSKYSEIIIWGACFSSEDIGSEAGSNGKAADKLYKLLEKNGYQDKITMWVDSNVNLYGKQRYGRPVVSPTEILKHTDALVIINSISIQSILNSARSLGIDNDIMIIPYYYYRFIDSPNDDIAKKYIHDNADEIKRLYYIEDNETSRYLDIILKLNSLDEDLFPCDFYEGTGKGRPYFCDDTIAPKGNVTLIDVGAYIGDSITPVRKKYGNRLKSILAFEPNPENCEKLKAYINSSQMGGVYNSYISVCIR